MSSTDYYVLRKSVKDLFSGDEQYTIPQYQRNYAWTVDEAERLFKDLTDVGDAETFSPTANLLGAIVIKKDLGAQESEVVDGQQRLATLSLMFCAMRTYLYTFNDIKLPGTRPVIKHAIKTLDNLLKPKPDTIRITLGSHDQELFRDIITNKDPHYEIFCEQMRKKYQNGKKRIAGSHSRMIKNYQTLCIKTSEWAKNFKLNEFKDKNGDKFIESMNKLSEQVTNMTDHNHFAHIQVHDRSVAYKIFTTFNSVGQDLLQADLIKSHLLTVTETNKVTQTDIKNSWQKIFDERLENHDKFLYESLSSRHPPGSIKVSDQNIPISTANMYKIIESCYNSSEKAREFVDHLKTDAKHIKYMDYPEDLDDDPKYDKIKSDFHGIQLLNARYIRVPILAAYRVWEQERPEDIEKLIDCLLVFFFKFKFINDGTAEAVRTIANNVTKKIIGGESLSAIIYYILTDEDVLGEPQKRINEDDFIKNFQHKMFKITTNIAKYILSSFEIYIRKETNKETTYPSYNFELEHILPRRHEKYWDEQKFLDTPHSDSINKYKNRLGNLTLLSRKWNRNLGAKDFETKRIQEETGYARSDFLINQKYLKDYDEWTASNLEKRESILCSIADKVWSLDKHYNSSNVTGNKNTKI